jgi:hypothetical protein
MPLCMIYHERKILFHLSLSHLLPTSIMHLSEVHSRRQLVLLSMK